MEITVEMVKSLRDVTGAGMMECKKALQESNGDIEQAKKYFVHTVRRSPRSGRAAKRSKESLKHTFMPAAE